MSPGERLKQARLQAGYPTVAAAARSLKLHKQNWADHEAGRRAIREHNAREYARKLKISWIWLLTGQNGTVGRKVPLVGYVGAGSQVHAFGAQQLEYIEAPPGTEEDDVAFELRGASMPPFRDGGVIIARSVADVSEVLYRLAVVDLEDGTRWFKQIMPSSVPGRFTLVSLLAGADPMPDVRIVRAARFRVYVEPA